MTMFIALAAAAAAQAAVQAATPPASPQPSVQPMTVAPAQPVETAQAGAPQPLQLTCFGAGSANKFRSAIFNSNSSTSGMVGSVPYSGSSQGSASVLIPREQEFSDQLDIRLFGGDDRIRLPRVLLPMFHGGEGGWFKLKNVVADDRSIKASVAVNFINSPKVFIDRVTGTISIAGKAGNYAGQCQVIDANAPPKF